MEARKGLPSQEPPRSHRASSRWPRNGSGRGGGPATLVPQPPRGVGGKQGKQKEPRAQRLPVRPGTPHTPGRHTCSFAEPSHAGGWRLPGRGQLPAAARRTGLRTASPSGPYVAAYATGGMPRLHRGERGYWKYWMLPQAAAWDREAGPL